MKYRDKKTQITIDLPEDSKYNGYCVECSYSFDKDKCQYSVSMKLQRKDMDELQNIDDIQYVNGDKKTVDFSIRYMIEKLSKSDFFDKYVQRYEYTYKCFDKGNEFYEEEVKRLGGKKIVLEFKRYKNSLLNTLSQAIAFYKFCKENKDTYKIIHFQSIGANGFFDIIAAKLAGIPCRVAHSHIANDIKPNHKSNKKEAGKLRKYYVLGRQKIIKGLVSKFSTHYFGCSKMACEWMFSKKINRNKLTTRSLF